MSTFEQMLQDEINEIKSENDITDHSCILLTEEIRDLLDEEVTDSHLSEEIQNLIGMVHNSTVQEGTKIGIAGHGAVEIALRRLYKRIDENPKFENFKTWENMRYDVRTLIRKCPCCQKMAKLKIPIQTRPFTTSAYGIWDCIAIDTIGPLPESPLGHKYILTVIDKFSRFIEYCNIRPKSYSSSGSFNPNHWTIWYASGNRIRQLNAICKQSSDRIIKNYGRTTFNNTSIQS